MPEYKLKVALRNCQYRTPEGKIITARFGEPHVVPVDHVHFREIGEVKEGFSLLTASEAELMQTPLDRDEVDEFLFNEYGTGLRSHPEMSKRDIISQILDARYRTISAADINRLDNPVTEE